MTVPKEAHSKIIDKNVPLALKDKDTENILTLIPLCDYKGLVPITTRSEVSPYYTDLH
jgi:hypothetical protein